MVRVDVGKILVTLRVFYKANNLKGIVKLSQGTNAFRESFNGCCYGCHAEIAAMKRLPPYKRNKKNKKRRVKRKAVNLLVIRTTRAGELRNSRPCTKCIRQLSTLRYYKIKNIYYSNAKGDIVMERWSYMSNCKHIYYSKRFRYKS